VTVLEAATGAIRWFSVLPAGEATGSGFHDVRFDEAGHVVAVMKLAAGSESNFALVSFDGSTGAQRWRRGLTGSSAFWNAADRLAVGPTGRVVVVGTSTWVGTGSDATVWSVDAATGSD
jgi:hypothetical protein